MASDVMTPVLCNICDKLLTAKFYCNTCGDALCPTCKEHHLKSKGSGSHEVVPYSKKKEPTYYANFRCSTVTHETKAAENWCDTCNVPICVKCITNKHKGHVFSIIAIKLSEKRDAMQKEITTTLGVWNEQLKTAKNITNNYHDNIKKAEEMLVERANEMHKQVGIILYQCQENLKELKKLNNGKLLNQERNINTGLQQIQRENQLEDPIAVLQFKEGSIQTKWKMPPIGIPSVSTPIFIIGQDDTNAMQKIFGQLSTEGRSSQSTREEIGASKESVKTTTKDMSNPRKSATSTTNGKSDPKESTKGKPKDTRASEESLKSKTKDARASEESDQSESKDKSASEEFFQSKTKDVSDSEESASSKKDTSISEESVPSKMDTSVSEESVPSKMDTSVSKESVPSKIKDISDSEESAGSKTKGANVSMESAPSKKDTSVSEESSQSRKDKSTSKESAPNKKDTSVSKESVPSKKDTSVSKESARSKKDTNVSKKSIPSKIKDISDSEEATQSKTKGANVSKESAKSKKDTNVSEESAPSKKDTSVSEESVPSKKDTNVSEESAPSKIKDISDSEESVRSKKDTSISEESVPSKKDTSVSEESVPSKKDTSVSEESAQSKIKDTSISEEYDTSTTKRTIVSKESALRNTKKISVPTELIPSTTKGISSSKGSDQNTMKEASVQKESNLSTTKATIVSKESSQGKSSSKSTEISLVQLSQQMPLSVATQKSPIHKPLILSEFLIDYYYPHLVCEQHGLTWVQTESKTLQLMDKNGSVKITIINDSDISDMAITSHKQLLLVDESSYIKSVSKEKKIDKMFKPSWHPTGLCFLPTENIAVAFGYCGKVKVYHSNGTISQHLDNINFRHPFQVAANKKNWDMYVCDHESDGFNDPGKVIAIEADGELRYEYYGQGSQTFRPMGVCSDRMGHVLITDYGNHQINILDKDGNFIQYLLTSKHGLYNPVSIDVDSNGFVWVGRKIIKSKGQIKVAKYLHFRKNVQ